MNYVVVLRQVAQLERVHVHEQLSSAVDDRISTRYEQQGPYLPDSYSLRGSTVRSPDGATKLLVSWTLLVTAITSTHWLTYRLHAVYVDR